MCRARVYSDQWRTSEVLDDALAAMALFEEAGQDGLALDATSLAAAFASRLGELSLSAELCAKSILNLDSVGADHSLVAEVTNRLGIVCYSFLAYDRAAEQYQVSLAAAERAGDHFMIARQLHNIADVLLLTVRDRRGPDGTGPAGIGNAGPDRLERASRVLQRLQASTMPGEMLAISSQRLRAELLLETGHPGEALGVIAGATQGVLTVPHPQRAAFGLVECRCLRALGRGREAVEAAERAVQLALASGDDHELMLTLKERSAAKKVAGDTEGALADAVEVNERMWAIHQRQTAQVVEQVWVRTALERERRQLEETTAAAVRSAEEDALTRIGNRRLLTRFLDQAEAGTPLALVIADIDLFKEINDTFGHELGDLVLATLGRLFAAQARPGQVVVRYGGEEFVFALPGTDTALAAGFAERVRMRVASYAWEELDARLGVTISLGVASGGSDAWRSVLASADGALYRAKRRGRNRVEAASPGPQQTASRLRTHKSGIIAH